MKLNRKKHILMDEKVHYKMYKAGKLWLVAGITTFGFGISLGLASTSTKAVASGNASAPVVQEQPKLETGLQNNSQSSSPLGNLMRDGIQGRISETFQQHYINQLTASNSKALDGYLQAGSDHTGNLKLSYFNGYQGPGDAPLAALANGQISSSYSYVWGTNVRNQAPNYLVPDFNILQGNGGKKGWLWQRGAQYNSYPFIAGINNDMSTMDTGTNWRLWSVTSSNTENMASGTDQLNKTITLKATGDFKFGTPYTYTLDVTMTLMPMGSVVDYSVDVRNITSVAQPNNPNPDLKNFWFGSMYDTMLGGGYSVGGDGSGPDAVPFYYTGENQGLYLQYGGYKLKVDFSGPSAPTGWAADGSNFGFNGQQTKTRFTKPTDLGQKTASSATAPKKGTVAWPASYGDSALNMIWEGKDLKNDGTRHFGYQVSLSSDTAVLPKVTLDKMTDNYTGGDYTVNGKINYPNNGGGKIRYYYTIDSGTRVEFEGPQFTDSATHDFKFTIPAGSMDVGNEHQVVVYATDPNGSASENQSLKLTAQAQIKTKDMSYFVGDKFDKFDCFDGGLDVDATQLKQEKVQSAVVKNASGQVVSNLATVTANPGKYTVTYTYTYGNANKGGSTTSTANFVVYAVTDPNVGFDYSVRDRTYYVGETFNADDNFVSGRKNGNKTMLASELTHVTKNVIGGPDVLDTDITKTAGIYKVTYKFAYGNNNQTLDRESTVKVIDAKHITLKYVDQKGNAIDPKFLTGISGAMTSGDHGGLYGSDFTLSPSQSLPVGGNTGYYTFVRAESTDSGTPTPLPSNKLTFGDSDQHINLVYQGAPVNPNSNPKSQVVVHHKLQAAPGQPERDVPGMTDTIKGGNFGDTITINPKDPEHAAPAGYTIVPNQSSYTWVLQPNLGKDITYYYTANTLTNITVKFVNARTKETLATDNPEGKTGDTLDLSANGSYVKGKIPAGYHYATTPDELNGNIQTTGMEYKPTAQEVTVFLAGDEVKPSSDSKNSIVVHHYLKGTKTNVPGMSDTFKGGFVGSTVVIKAGDPEQAAPAGYTIVAHPDVSLKLEAAQVHQEVTFEYTANQYDNIHISFTDVSTGNEVKPTYTPTGHHTGDELDFSSPKDNPKSDLAGHIPDGYHVAKDDELKDKDGKKVEQPANPSYTAQDQYPSIWVIGDPIGENDTNALTVHHYIKGKTDKDGKPVPVPGMKDIKKGGRVGQTIKVQPTAAAPGYTLDPASQETSYTFDPKKPGEITFYYTANQYDNIHIHFTDVTTGKEVTPVYTPTGHHTGDTIDIVDKDVAGHLPPGYHVAKEDELKDKNGNKVEQPKNPSYTDQKQDPAVWVIGDTIGKDDANALIIHHMMKDKDGKDVPVPTMPDIKQGGRVGQTINVKPTKAAAGYTLDPTSQAVDYTFKPKDDNSKPGEITFYYTADQNDNIHIHFTDVTTGDEVTPTYTPTGHHTGDTIDIVDKDVAGHLPPGYHVAKEDELKDKNGNKVEQPKNPSYTDQKQDPAIWVIGDTIGKDDANALIIHHMMKDKDGKDVPVPTMPDIKQGGRVGQTINVKPTKAAAGYTLDPTSQAVDYTFKPKDDNSKPGEITFYYTPDQNDNIHIHFTDVTTGDPVEPTYTPTGHHTGDTIDIVDKDVAGHLPPGYHVAKEDELKDKNGNKVEQPKNPSYTDQKQDPAVWVIGDTIGKDDANALIIHHMMKDKDGKDVPVPTMPDIKQGGRVGQTINVKPTKAAAGYTLDPTSQAVDYTFKPKDDNSKPGEITFYYTADQNDNIHIHFTDVTTGDEVTPTYTPTGHHTGDTIDIVDKDVAGHLPPGYHVAKEDELKDKNGNKVEQPKNPSYTDQKQDPAIWVIGDTIGKDDANALIIHHMMKDKDGKDVPVPTMPDIKQGGRVGQTINVKPTKAAAGYTLDPTSQAVDYTFKPKDDNSKPGEINFYYTPDQNDNIHIHFTDVTTGDPVEPTYTPTGHHTGDTIDIVDKDVAGHLPPGYHVAKEDELKDKNGNKVEQPKNPSYTDQKQDPAIWVIGDTIGKDDANALIIHHMMKDKDGKDVPVPTMPDIKQGGRVGQTINVKPTKAAAGYTLDPTSQAVDYTFKPKDDNSKPGEITFYYTADQNDNIHIHFTDVTTGDPVEPTYTPTGHHTGDTIDIVDKDVAGHLPPGYHVAKEDELKDKNGNKVEQPKNPSYTDQKQDPAIWVIGDTIGKDDANALIIHHMMKDKDGKDVPVPTMPDIKQGGRVGQTINVKPTKAAAGYTLDPTSQAVDYTFKPKDDNSKPGEITFYYTADQNDNIHIHFTDVTTGDEVTPTYTPTGHHTGDTIDIVDKDVAGHLPPGYHVAKEDELKDKNGNKVEQPKNPSYTDQKQDPAVWVIGDDIGENDSNSLIIHHYIKDKKDKDGKPVKVPGMDDIKKGGRVGQILPVQPTQAVPGYSIANGENTINYTFKPKTDNSKPGEIAFYYTANTQTNITVDFVNINGAGKDIVGHSTPQNHFTGDELDLSNDPEIKSAVPNGYQLATDPELKDKGLTRPVNPTYGPQAPTENPIVYVVGKETTASNALTVHHKIKGPNNTETNVPGMPDITMNGRVGETIKVQPTAPIAGYTLSSESKETAYKFKPDSTGDITFYYTAKEQSNVTINFVNAKNGKTVKTDSPKGKTGDTLDLTSKTAGSYIDNTLKQTGYHYAENGELNGNSQPDKNLEFSTTPQTQTVYVAGDVVDGTSHASSRVTIHHYLKGTATPVPGMGEVGTGNSYKGGIIGDNVTVSPDDPEQKAPAGYTIVPNQQPDTWELTADGGHEVTYYYTADSIDNISIQFVNASDPTKKVGMPYIPSGHVTGDNLKVDSDEVKGHVPAGYHVASKAELDDLGSSLTQPELVYGVTSGVQTVYVIGEAQSNITVHFLDAKTLKELGTVTPKENPDSNSNPKASYRTGDVLKLDAASNYVSDFINAHTGYSYTSNSELSSMNLKQPENPTYTTQSQDINVYLSPQSKATHILKVIHKEQLPSTRGVRGLKDFQTSIEEGSDYDFDINDSAHKAPRGYTLIPGQESKLKGTMGTDGKEIILYYAKIR